MVSWVEGDYLGRRLNQLEARTVSVYMPSGPGKLSITNTVLNFVIVG